MSITKKSMIIGFMKKSTPSSPSTSTSPNPTLADQLEEHPMVQWFSNNGLTVVYALLGCALLFMLIYRFYGGSTQSQQDFYEAESSMTELQQSPEDAKASLAKLEKILYRNPDLHAKYDGLIAQALLNLNNVQEALPFAENAIARTKSENAPFFTDFANTTLLIAEKKYDQALQNAKDLNKKITEQTEALKENSLLFAYNLLRIGMLQQQLGQKEEARQTWKQWMEFAKNATEKSSAANMNEGFLTLNQVFIDGKLDLLNYMSHQLQK